MFRSNAAQQSYHRNENTLPPVEQACLLSKALGNRRHSTALASVASVHLTHTTRFAEPLPRVGAVPSIVDRVFDREL